MPPLVADVLLLTATAVESKAALQAFAVATTHQPIVHSLDGRIYFDLGTVNGARLCLSQSEMGAGGLGATLQTTQKGITALQPATVIMVGIAFGVDEARQAIGDILVTEQLHLYDLQRVGTDDGQPQIRLRGDKPHASPWLLNHLKSADLLWHGARVHFGCILSGEKLVDNLDFRKQLRRFEPEAIGGEMEGAGLYVACQNQKVDWLLVKAICDWADGTKGQDKDARQLTAATNAAAFVWRFSHGCKSHQPRWNAPKPLCATAQPTAFPSHGRSRAAEAARQGGGPYSSRFFLYSARQNCWGDVSPGASQTATSSGSLDGV